MELADKASFRINQTAPGNPNNVDLREHNCQEQFLQASCDLLILFVVRQHFFFRKGTIALGEAAPCHYTGNRQG